MPRVTDYVVKVDAQHEEFRQVLREFAAKEIEPIAKEIDRTNAVPDSLIKKGVELGLPGIGVREEYGGTGAGMLSLAIVVEEISRISAACSVVFVASYLVSEPLQEFGTGEQKRRFLVPLAKGQKFGAHAMTEPGAGSDVAGIQTTARKDDGEYVINGRKIFITNGDRADIFLVFARTAPPPSPDKRHLGISAFLMERGTPGLQTGKKIETIGLRGSQPVEIILDDVRVPKENILGREGEGAYVALNTYDRGRIGVSAQGVGIAQAAYEAALKYAATRKAFESRLLEFQQVQFKLAEMAVGLHSARLLTYWAASLLDQGKDFVKAASIAKIVATEAAEKAALAAMMIHGAYGVVTDYPVERYLRDVQIIKTYEGTNDIQRLTIAKELIKELR